LSNHTKADQCELPLPSFYDDKRVARLLQSIPAGVVIHGADTEVLFANHQACKILGLSAEQIMGRVAIDPSWAFVDENSQPLTLDRYPVHLVLNSKTPLENYVIGIIDKSPARWAVCNGFIDLDDQGEVKGAVICFCEVSELRQHKLDLLRSEERYRLILEGSRDGLWDWDMARNEVFYSDRWFEMLGYHPGEVVPAPKLWMHVCHPEDLPMVKSVFARVSSQTSESIEFEGRLRHKHGHYVPVLTRGRILRDESGKPVRIAGSNMDLTERKRYEQHIELLAFNDPLTGLPNRRYLLEYIARAIRVSARSQKLCGLMFVDLDFFKQLNDSLGHNAGDVLLQQVANTLKANVRTTDTVARLGGDEFVVLLESIGSDASSAAQHAKELGQKVLDALHQITTPLPGYQVKASIGITSFDSDASSIEDLLKQADAAMYQAKTSGRDCLHLHAPNPSS
jgi:diguanylate cyclase (GGDEF)-like protein/PAS domain S-box-containing protein